MKIKKLNESGQARSSRFNTYKDRIEKAIEKSDAETLKRTKEAIMYAPAKELKNSEAKELMDMIKGAKLEEALTGYKITVVKDGETFDDYACAYEEAGAIQQMKNKYGNDIEVKDVAVSKVIKEGLQPADEWYLKVYPEDSEGAAELKGLFIDDVIKDKGNLDKYGFSDRLKGILDNEFKRYSPMVANESKSIKTLGAKAKKLNESATHCVYFTQDGKDQIEFEGTEDECKKYIADIQAEQDDEFGDEAPERFVKRLNEDTDVQYGVHQFSTDSIIFRGTEEECGKYIDNNKKLWDDAEVYRMTPDDPHYKKVNEAVDINSVVSKYNDAFYDEEQQLIDCGSEATCKAIAKELGIGPDRTSNSPVAHEIWLDESKKINEASYGGAFDIADDQYFSREDLLYFADEVLGHVAETFNGVYDIGGVWFENGNVVTQIVDDSDNMYENTTKVDMRKIREPWHLKKMYAFPVAADIIQQIKDTDGDVVVENVQSMGEYSDKFYDYLDFLVNEGKTDNIIYLAHQLIRYCKEDDLKDLWNDKMNKTAQSVGYESGADNLEESLEEEVNIARRYLDAEIPDLCHEVYDRVDNMPEYKIVFMNSKLRQIHTLLDYFKETYERSKVESLTESNTDAETIKTGPAVGMAAVVSDLIKDEYEAIDGYNSAIATAESEGFSDAVKVLSEIQAEENVHIGQLQEVMKLFDPNADKIEEGQVEGAEQLNNPAETPNNNIEESAEMQKERWEEIYDSFKTVEKELNQDGEAVTAVVDQMYRDNKEDPDYQKAYDKWSSGE